MVGLRVRSQDETEPGWTFLVGPVIGTPMVVHGPRIKRLRALDLFAPNFRVGLGIEQRRGDSADFDQGRVQCHPGNSHLIV